MDKPATRLIQNAAAIASLAVLAPLALNAATDRYWQGGDGDWTDKAHWEGGNIPKGGEVARWKSARYGTVNVNTNAYIGYWALSDKSPSDAANTVRWIGTGTVTNGSTSTTYVGIGRNLIIDGPDVFVNKSLSVHPTNACLEVRSGHLHTVSGISVNFGSSLLVNGGRLTSSVTVNKGAAMSVTDGSAYIYSTFEVNSNAVVSVSGGKLEHTYSNSKGTINGGGRISVSGGEYTTYGVTIKEGATLDISGGTAKFTGSFSANTNATVNLSGGTLRLGVAPTLAASAFSFTGGTLVWANTTSIGASRAHFLPPAGTTFEHRSSGSGFWVDSSGTYSFDGTYVATNRNTGHPNVYNYKTSLGFTGNGTFIVDAFRIRNGFTTTIRSKAVKLGHGLKAENSGGATFSFPDGMEFGAWDDWDNANDQGDPSYIPTIRLAGRISFDTLDCIDGVSKRSVTLTKCTDGGMTSLSASGGGTVSLTFSGGISALDALVVEAGTTLWLTNSSGSVSAKSIRLGDGAALHATAPMAGCESIILGAGATLDIPAQSSTLRLRRLVLGDDARLLMTAGLGSVETAFAPVVGDGAKIVFTMPETVTAGTLHAVWCAPAWDGDLSSAVEIVGLEGSGWTLKRVGSTAYLSDGTVPAVTGNSTTPGWIGETSSLWSEKSNWTADTVLNGQKYGYFGRDVNPYVTNDVARSIRYPWFLSNSGPYYLAGKQLTLSYGNASNNNSNSIRDESPMPVVIDNPLAFSGSCAFIRNTASSCLLLRGGGRTTGGIYTLGDVRLGGAWSATNAVLTTSNSRLTVLPGGSLTITATGGAFTVPAWLAVDGLLDVSNTFAFASSARLFGSGNIRIRDVETNATASFPLADALTLYPLNGWTTVGADAPAAAVTISAIETPTLGALGNWRYGPAVGAFPETTEAERALKVAVDATLSIDTEDPDTGAGHVITFADPIMGEGSVVKTGAGTLSFATTNSVISGVFRVEEGTVNISGAVSAAAERGWTRILSAGSLEGVQEALPARLKSRIVENGDLRSLEVRAERHTVFMVK